MMQLSTAACSLGWVLAAGDSRGLRHMWMDDDRTALLEAFAHRYPAIQLDACESLSESTLQSVLQAIEKPWLPSDLAIAPQGTPFQQSVWAAIRNIPAGHTVTYAQLAQSIGRPQSTRAVAKACSENPIAIIIPCHRVVKSDGGLGGYRWDIDRKFKLLDREMRHASHP